jgi:hypothetical protein
MEKNKIWGHATMGKDIYRKAKESWSVNHFSLFESISGPHQSPPTFKSFLTSTLDNHYTQHLLSTYS